MTGLEPRFLDKDAFTLIGLTQRFAQGRTEEIPALWEGLMARSGEIPDFTGISAPYEAPENAELVVDTAGQTVEESVARIIEYVEQNFEFAKQPERPD